MGLLSGAGRVRARHAGPRLDEESGKQLAGNERWSDRAAYAGIDPGAIFRAIFATSRPRGYYRLLVFVLTDDPPMTRPQGATETFAIASRWALAGRPSLPASVRAEPIGQNHELVLLVYEFEKIQGGETRQLTPSRWSIDHHLANLNISLQPRQ